MTVHDPSTRVRSMGWRHSSVAVTLLAEMRERQQAVGKRVVELRERQRLSQEDLAGKAGVSTKTISRLENGRYESRRNTIERVAVALGVSADDLDPAPAAPLGLGGPATHHDVVERSELQAILEELRALREDIAVIARAVALPSESGEVSQAADRLGAQLSEEARRISERRSTPDAPTRRAGGGRAAS